MSTSSGTDSTPFSGISSDLVPALETPTNWRDALVGLVASRIALIQLESKGAVRQVVTALASLALAALAAVFAWALILAGGIGALVVATSWSWYWIALGAALLHLLVVGVCLAIAKSAKTPTFPITRNEFLKDRTWLFTLKSPRK